MGEFATATPIELAGEIATKSAGYGSLAGHNGFNIRVNADAGTSVTLAMADSFSISKPDLPGTALTAPRIATPKRHKRPDRAM